MMLSDVIAATKSGSTQKGDYNHEAQEITNGKESDDCFRGRVAGEESL